MPKHRRIISGGSLLGVLALSLLLIRIDDAQAYLDPGTGSMILQAVIGAVAGALIVIKLYWYKLVSFFKGRKNGDKDHP